MAASQQSYEIENKIFAFGAIHQCCRSTPQGSIVGAQATDIGSSYLKMTSSTRHVTMTTKLSRTCQRFEECKFLIINGSILEHIK